MIKKELKLLSNCDKTFPKSENVEHSKVAFVNRFVLMIFFYNSILLPFRILAKKTPKYNRRITLYSAKTTLMIKKVNQDEVKYTQPQRQPPKLPFVVLGCYRFFSIARNTNVPIISIIYSRNAFKVFNTVDFGKCMHYNPFTFIKTDADIKVFVDILITSTKEKGEKSSDPFWENAERLLYMALIGYIIYELPEEEIVKQWAKQICELTGYENKV